MTSFTSPEDFYATYDAYKGYERPSLKAKHVRWLDAEFWRPAACRADMAFLEIGCGTGLFMLYLQHKRARLFVGLERDARAVAVMDPSIAARVVVQDIWSWLRASPSPEPFDRIVLFDVFEHFSVGDGVELLKALRDILTDDGYIVVRTPNMASPWGPQHQYSDLTHKSAYTPGSLRQLCLAAGYECIKVLPQRRGSPMRRLTEDFLHALLARLLTEPPSIWSANMIAVLRPKMSSVEDNARPKSAG